MQNIRHIYNLQNTISSRGLANTLYYAFGSSITEMQYASDTAGGYRYGFNNMERDDEMNVSGGSYDFGARIYDSRIGRWLSVDPLFSKYVYISPYNFGGCNPVLYIDKKGESIMISNNFQNSPYYPVLLNFLKMGDSEFNKKYLCKYSGTEKLNLYLLYNFINGDYRDALGLTVPVPLNSTRQQITFNHNKIYNYLPNSGNGETVIQDISELGMALIIMHEVLHTNLDNIDEHEKIATELFSDLTSGIKAYAKQFNLSLVTLATRSGFVDVTEDEAAEALAWIGLEGTSTYIAKFGEEGKRTAEQESARTRMRRIQEVLLYNQEQMYFNEELEEKINEFLPTTDNENEKPDIKVE